MSCSRSQTAVSAIIIFDDATLPSNTITFCMDRMSTLTIRIVASFVPRPTTRNLTSSTCNKKADVTPVNQDVK